MQPIPVRVKNVTIYAYFNPTEPLSEVILEGGAGTYSVGTLTTNVFYNLDLSNGGTRVNPLQVHGRYVAVFDVEGSGTVTSPWMYCLDNSKQPKFGRTVTFGEPTLSPDVVGPLSTSANEYIKLSPMTNITATQVIPPPGIGEKPLIAEGSGYLIATRTGTPHLMGIQVDNGKRLNRLVQGMKNVAITGHLESGQVYTLLKTTVISADEPAIFLKSKP